MAVFTSVSLSSGSTGKSSLMASNRSKAIRAAISYPSATRIGWIPLSNNCSACSRSAPAKTRIHREGEGGGRERERKRCTQLKMNGNENSTQECEILRFQNNY